MNSTSYHKIKFKRSGDIPVVQQQLLADKTGQYGKQQKNQLLRQLNRKYGTIRGPLEKWQGSFSLAGSLVVDWKKEKFKTPAVNSTAIYFHSTG